MKKEITSFEDLEIYQKLLQLHFEVNEMTLQFPKFEMYELGSQMRRASNSIPANLAEGWNNKHITIYLEGINRAMGELQEMKHHLYVALKKKYLNQESYDNLKARYDECARMLRGLQQSLEKYRT